MHFLLLVSIATSFLCFRSGYTQTIAHDGVIDLREYSFEDNSRVSLDGEWGFYWEKLISPDQTSSSQRTSFVEFPHLWNDFKELDNLGYATYRLTVLLPESHPPLAINIPDTYSSYKMFINREEVARNGNVADNAEDHIPKWVNKSVSLDQFNGQPLELVFQVANFEHSKGGIWRSPIIGSEAGFIASRTNKNGFIILITGGIIMGGLFFFGLYTFGRHDKAILYFSLFCFVYCYRLVGAEPYTLHMFFPDLPWWFTTKLEYLSMFLSAPLFGLFVKSLYPQEVHDRVIQVFNAYYFILCLVIIVTPAIIYTRLLDLFFLPTAAYIIYSSVIFASALRNKRDGAVFAVSSTFVIFFVFVHTRLEFNGIVEERLYIDFFGYILFFVLQSLILSFRFANSLTLAKEEAESALMVKSHFLSAMGHELRTPLNAVIGLSELLVGSKSEEEKTKFAKTIKTSGESLLGIINNILDFSKIESDKVEAEHEPVHIPMLLADIIKILGSLADQEKISLSFKFDDSLSSHFETDPIRLRQVLINLIGNAIKFTDKGDISVEVSLTEAYSDSNKIQALFVVRDSGIGIPEEKMPLLFDRFTQLDADRNRKYGGSGLGLAISKRIVESMGGKIWVESKVSEGSSFFFTIDVQKARRPNKDFKNNSSADNGESLNGSGSILVVEDNKINQTVVLKVLERLGVKADVANNGFEALDKVQEKDYDLIFMDMEMPGMDGIEATQKIKTLKNLPSQPVIVAMTANVTSEDKLRCFEAGMQDFISKPITLQTTKAALIRWVPGSKSSFDNKTN